MNYKIISNIDPNNYIESLLNNLLEHHHITKEDYNKIVLKFIYLLSILVNKYSGGLINSINIDIAKNINESNMWVIGLYLKNKPIDEIINILKYDDILNIYNLSNNYIDNYINNVKFKYNIIKVNFIKNDNYYYNSTLYDGIKGFFKIYNKSYDAKNKCLTFDYIPYLDIFNLEGIEYLNRYLEYINYENIYCNKFDNKKIINLLNNIYQNYEELPINIFETVFLISLLSKYQNINIYDLNSDLIDTNRIYRDYDSNKDKFIDNLNQSFIKIKEELNVKDNSYLNNSFNKMIKNILFYCNSRTLNNVLGRDKNTEILYYLKPQMNNIKYNKLVIKLNELDDTNKIDYLINNISSILDLIDLFNDVYFTSTELNILFSKLSNIDIMVIKKINILNNDYIIDILNKYLLTKNKYEQKIINNNFRLIKLVIQD